MRLVRLLLATVTASVLSAAAACTAPAARGPFVVPPAPCADLAMVWARGSSMPVRSSEARSAQQRFRDAAAVLAPGRRVETFELGDLDADGRADVGGYPAVAGGQMPGIDLQADPERELVVIGGYNESRRVGAAELHALLGTLADRCPSERFVVAGISQGADTVVTGLEGLPPDLVARTASVQLFGDPRFMVGPWMEAPGTEIPSGHGILGTRPSYVPAPLLGRTTSWCGQFDGVCSGQVWFTVLDAVKECAQARELPACSRRHIDYERWAFAPAMDRAVRTALATS